MNLLLLGALVASLVGKAGRGGGRQTNTQLGRLTAGLTDKQTEDTCTSMKMYVHIIHIQGSALEPTHTYTHVHCVFV